MCNEKIKYKAKIVVCLPAEINRCSSTKVHLRNASHYKVHIKKIGEQKRKTPKKNIHFSIFIRNFLNNKKERKMVRHILGFFFCIGDIAGW